ncbi:MAG: RDD family protein [Pseudomonadota bacterium]
MAGSLTTGRGDQPLHVLGYAGFWRRTLAMLLDIASVAAILYMIQTFTFAPLYTVEEATGSISVDVSPLAVAAVFVFWALCVWRFSGSFGKALMNIRVVRADDLAPLRLPRALGRTFSYIVSAMPFLIGFLWVGLDARKQGFHDKIAGTVCLHVQSEHTNPPQA